MHAFFRHTAQTDQRRRTARARGGAVGAMAPRSGGGSVSCRSFRPRARGERRGAGARPGARWLARPEWRRTGRRFGRARHIVGAGCQGREARRAALSRRTARGLAAAVDPRPRPPAGRCAVRARGGGALPRARVRDRRAGGQSARARFHRLATADAGGRAAWRAALPRAARCPARPVRRAHAVGGGERLVAGPALERRCARGARLAGGAVPLAPPPARALDPAR